MGQTSNYFLERMSDNDVNAVLDEEIETIAFNVRQLRKKKKITQQELSESANISLGTIIKIEKGIHRNVTYNQIRRLSLAFDVPVSHIIKMDFGVENMDSINRFILYYPLMSQYDIYEVFSAVNIVNDSDSLQYLKDRLNRIYESFPPKIKAFIELKCMSEISPKYMKGLSEDKIPEPYNELLSLKEYHDLENRYDNLIKYKMQQYVLQDPIAFMESGELHLTHL